jgi:sugar lactone lactonase YvrE
VGLEGHLYFAEPSADQIVVVSSRGDEIARLGRRGREPGEYRGPVDVAVDSHGDIYVADFWNQRIQKLDRNGTPYYTWGWEAGATSLHPWALSIDRNDNLYATDLYGNRVLKFSPDGQLSRTFAIPDEDQYVVRNPGSVAVDDDGTVYVVAFFDNLEYQRAVLYRFSPRGWLQEPWQSGFPEDAEEMPNFFPLSEVRGDIAVDRARGVLYVSDGGRRPREIQMP